MQPVKISIKNKEYLDILWDDNKSSQIQLNKLRSNCPCAFCLDEKEKNGKTYFPLYTKDEITVSGINEVGHYAIGINWKDGHNTGIYEFEHLQNLSK